MYLDSLKSCSLSLTASDWDHYCTQKMWTARQVDIEWCWKCSIWLPCHTHPSHSSNYSLFRVRIQVNRFFPRKWQSQRHWRTKVRNYDCLTIQKFSSWPTNRCASGYYARRFKQEALKSCSLQVSRWGPQKLAVSGNDGCSRPSPCYQASNACSCFSWFEIRLKINNHSRDGRYWIFVVLAMGTETEESPDYSNNVWR